MMKTIGRVAMILVIVGGLNWGLVGAMNYNLVESLLGMGLITKIIYDVIGLAALYSIYAMFTMDR